MVVGVVVVVVVGVVVVAGVVVVVGVVVDVGVGAGVVMTTAVAADVATALPFLFVAMTVTRTVEPTSVAVTACVALVSPVIAAQPAPPVSQRDHWYANVAVGPDQLPVVADSVWPGVLFPLTVGGVSATGAA